jgi:hypothetical protein
MTIEAVIDLIEMGAVAPQDIVKCLRSSLRDTPQRQWVGLTDDDVFEALTSVDKETKRVPFMLMRFASAIQAKLKEKNHG